MLSRANGLGIASMNPRRPKMGRRSNVEIALWRAASVMTHSWRNSMSAFKPQAAAFVYSILSLGSLSVFGQTDGGITLTINNNTSDNLLVTIYDLGVSPRQTILSNRAIYGNASITVSISEGASGSGHVLWTAMSQDSDMRMCGHEDKTNLKNGDVVSVYADGDCSR
jgi:hypothetical protein